LASGQVADAAAEEEQALDSGLDARLWRRRQIAQRLPESPDVTQSDLAEWCVGEGQEARDVRTIFGPPVWHPGPKP
jgi:hypothetical protein